MKKRNKLDVIFLGSLLFIPIISVLADKWYIKFIGLLWAWFMCIILAVFQEEVNRLKHKLRK